MVQQKLMRPPGQLHPTISEKMRVLMGFDILVQSQDVSFGESLAFAV